MGLISDYYLNAATLSEATHVYTDAALSSPGPAGWYSANGVYRQVVGSLGEFVAGTFSCKSCSASCPRGLSTAFQGPRVYSMTVDLGSTTGATLIEFVPGATPHGIVATLNGVQYKALSSPIDGYHSSTVAGPTYLGDDSDACSTGFLAGAPYAAVPEYNFYDGAFYDTGDTTNVFVDAGNLSFTSGAVPGTCTMVVPKTVNNVSELTIEVYSPASCITSANIQVNCPTSLAPNIFSGTEPGVSSLCGADMRFDFYNVPITGAAGNPQLHDWVFQDVNGETPLPDGQYIFDVGGPYGSPYVITNGVVTSVGAACPP